MPAPHVVVLTTGGTIASLKDPDTGAVRAAASPEDLLQLVPDVGDIADVTPRPAMAINSWNITPPMMLDLVTTAIDALRDDVTSGVVVTHGTDTVEETGMLAWMLNPTGKPVVLTAAMRNLSEAGPDGPRNLRDAIRVAASPESRNWRSLLVVNETIHDARFVTKTSTVNPSTFASPHGGPAGEASVTGIEFFRPPGEHGTVSPAHLNAEVPIVKTWTGMDASMIDWYRERGVDGLVLEGSGAGNVPGAILPGIERMIAADRPVVLTTRCISGPLAPVYGTGGASGGGFDLMRAGVIPASRLTAQKARIALLAHIGASMTNDAINQWFRGV